MSEELVKVVCGQCDGKMRVKNVDHAVVCPHCSSHLRVTEQVAAGSPLAVESGSGVLDRVTSRSGLLRKGADATPPTPSSKPTVSRNLFILVASYASAVTLALTWFLFSGKPHALESLPDVRTLADDELEFVGFDTPLPDGHDLAIDETRRFGDVLVTPLRVTREPIEFEHYENKDATRSATNDVLKLWLRFRNVSNDIAFPPFDVTLMSRRVPVDSGAFAAKANTFLCKAGEPRTAENVVLNYEHDRNSEWNIAQQPHQPLAPGNELTTFIASAEGARDLGGDLVWRVQFRKGVNRTSRRGVTTLIDVPFSMDDVD